MALRQLPAPIFRGAAPPGNGALSCFFQEGKRFRHPYSDVSRNFSSEAAKSDGGAHTPSSASSNSAQRSATSESPTEARDAADGSGGSLQPRADWEENPDLNISAFSELPHKNFGVNQHILINQELKEALRQILWQFRAPIRYAIAYGSGVFPQSTDSSVSGPSVHPAPGSAIRAAQPGKGKMIDMIFGVSYSQHWQSLNLTQHRDHYSMIGSLGSGFVTNVQERWGAGVYFNPYVTVNGAMIKYGVVNLDALCQDLSEWQTLYLAGRLHKPVKILRDDARVRLANQINLISALRTALLMLPPSFSEQQLYGAIAGISYMGDPRMSLRTENPRKVDNIVANQMTNFRRLYAPLIADLPNVQFTDPRCSQVGWHDDAGIDVRLAQDMDPTKRGNMVCRLPKAFREKLYFQFQRRYQIPQLEFDSLLEASSGEEQGSTRIKRRQGGVFDRRIAEDQDGLALLLPRVIKQTIAWPSTSQSIKGFFTAGTAKSVRYLGEKASKWREGRRQQARNSTLDETSKQVPSKSPSSPAPSSEASSQSDSSSSSAAASSKESSRPAP